MSNAAFKTDHLSHFEHDIADPHNTHTHTHTRNTHRPERQRCTGYDVTVNEDDYNSYLFYVSSITTGFLVGKSEGKRPLGKPRRRWEDNIKMDLLEVGCGSMDWIDLAQDRDR